MWRCVGYLLQLGGTSEGTVEWDDAFFLTQRIHRAFQDNDGIVGFAALTCGISTLCQLSVEDKVGASSETSVQRTPCWFRSLPIVLVWFVGDCYSWLPHIDIFVPVDRPPVCRYWWRSHCSIQTETAS